MIDFSPTQEQKQIQALARQFAREVIAPQAAEFDREERFPAAIVEQAAGLGLLNVSIPEAQGGLGLGMRDEVLMGEELAWGCMGIYSILMASELGITPIVQAGSEEQKERFLRPLAEGGKLAAFALSEPDNGSDAAAMKTRARFEGDEVVLDGTKMWITNGNTADIAIVWAIDEEGTVQGFIVPTDAPGFSANLIKHKVSLRASVTSELVLDGVRVPESARLPQGTGLRAPLGCLTQARYGIAWGAMGALEAVYEEALDFAKSRVTFERPIAARQLVQTSWWAWPATTPPACCSPGAWAASRTRTPWSSRR